MQHKTKKIWLIALLSLLIAALFAASFTYARYYKETGVTGGKYDDTIEFVGANKYIVYTPEELVSAIENGYSYIEIGEGAEEPFVITDGVTDVSANLVLDINGHDLVRNSRNPLIDVQENVSVVIVYDSKASGSFYNPVGSMLQASGGTLTIATGNFTSGPKEGDYVTDVGTTKDVTVYSRSSRGASAYDKKTENVSMPAGGKDMYFESAPASGANAYIKEDTFLIYTEETVETPEKETVETPEDATVNVDFSPLCDVASCDFYYYYEKSTEGSGEDKTTTYAVIYGYHDVMKGAEQQITKTGFNTSGSINNNSAEAVIWPYAAVRMTEGEAFIRGGTYTNQFGTAQSYGIYARGGSLSVQGEKTSFTSVEDGVCIRCTKEDGSAPSLHIENGSFTSYNGDTVWVNGGTMTVESGTFTKSGAGANNTKTAIIHMENGTLEAKGSADANGKKSIQMTCAASAGTLSNVFGVYSEGGTVELQNTRINVNGTYSAGVLAVTDGQAVSADKYAVTVADSAIEVNFNESDLSSSGISTEGGNIQLEGSVSVSSQGLGITARKGSINIKSGTASVETPRGTGVYVNKGTLTVNEKASLSVKSEMSENSWVNPPEVSGDVVTHYDGVVVEGGSLRAEGTLNVDFTGVANESHDTYDALNIRSYAVRVEQAALGGETHVTIASGKISNSSGGGVYVGGGTVTLGNSNTNGGPTIETTGTIFGSEHHIFDNDGNWKYYENQTGGHAVEVNGGDLLVYNGLYKAALGNGILVRGGNAWVINGVFQGNDTQDYQGNYGNDLPAGPAAYYALKLLGGSVTTFDGTFGTYKAADGTEYEAGGSSAFVTGVGDQATANIYGGSFVVSGQAGFSVYQNVALTFTPNGSANIGETPQKGSEVNVSAATAAIAIENTTDSGVSVTINGGKFNSTSDEAGGRDAIWYSNPNAKLTILDGTFTSVVRSGLYFEKAPNGSNVQLSGGTFTGDSAINAGNPGQITTGNILASNAWCFSRVPTSDEDTDGAICTYEREGRRYRYTQVGQGNSVHLNEKRAGWGLWSFHIQGNDGNDRMALNEYETVVIRTGTQITFER